MSVASIYIGSIPIIAGVSGTQVPPTASWAITASFALVTPIQPTASWAISASFALNGGGGTGPAQYATVTTSSTKWITASFLDTMEYVNINVPSATYSFTSSNHPIVGQYADTTIYINNTMVGATASLSFPALWNNMNGGWPTYLTASKVALVWLRAIDTNTVIGTFSQQF